MISTKPLFIIFVNSNLSKNLVELILSGKIHAHIYTLSQILQNLKKIFVNKTSEESNFKLIPCDLPYNLYTFNILLTSKNFWDNIPTNYKNIFVLYNPKGLKLNIGIKNKYDIPFTLFPLKPCNNLNELYFKNPSIIDENLIDGFLFYVQNKLARDTIKNCSKKNILSIRKEHNMTNNETIERQNYTSFYLYFWHYMINLGYNFQSNNSKLNN